MEVYKILMITFSFLFVFLAVKKILGGMSFEDYATGRGFILWLWFLLKTIFIIATLIFCIKWNFLMYEVKF